LTGLWAGAVDMLEAEVVISAGFAVGPFEVSQVDIAGALVGLAGLVLGSCWGRLDMAAASAEETERIVVVVLVLEIGTVVGSGAGGIHSEREVVRKHALMELE
jgi:hypothetical protein